MPLAAPFRRSHPSTNSSTSMELEEPERLIHVEVQGAEVSLDEGLLQQLLQFPE